jgi:hypothetical protein
MCRHQESLRACALYCASRKPPRPANPLEHQQQLPSLRQSARVQRPRYRTRAGPRLDERRSVRLGQALNRGGPQAGDLATRQVPWVVLDAAECHIALGEIRPSPKNTKSSPSATVRFPKPCTCATRRFSVPFLLHWISNFVSPWAATTSTPPSPG